MGLKVQKQLLYRGSKVSFLFTTKLQFTIGTVKQSSVDNIRLVRNIVISFT